MQCWPKPPPTATKRKTRQTSFQIPNSGSACVAASHCPHQSKQDHDSQPLANSISLAVPGNPDDCPLCALKQDEREVGESVNGEEDEEDVLKEAGAKEESSHEGDREERRSCLGNCQEMWKDMRRKLWGIVESKYFSRGIMIAILINTISMGIEHHNQVRRPRRPRLTSHQKVFGENISRFSTE